MPFSWLCMSSIALNVCVMCRSVKSLRQLWILLDSSFFCRCISMSSDTAICKSMCEFLFVFFCCCFFLKSVNLFFFLVSICSARS
uniref:Uncharacterized protein n=1 Tax=Ixodes scapularis TaxID=6945 RepID=A0A4D5RZ70_IXOSC